jgi:uncharacterized protein
MNNLETVQAIYQAFGRGDVGAILEVLHPDVEWEHDAVAYGVPWLQPRRGRQQVVEFFQAVAGIDFSRFEPSDFLVGKNRVFATIYVEAKLRATGRALKDFEGHLFTFDDAGRVTRFRHFVDTHQHLAASK